MVNCKLCKLMIVKLHSNGSDKNHYLVRLLDLGYNLQRGLDELSQLIIRW